MVMHVAMDESLVGRIETDVAFRQRFGNPYAVILRADVHLSLLEGAQESGRVRFHTNTREQRVEQDEAAKTVSTVHQHGQHWTGCAVIAADGGESVVREQDVSDPPRLTGHVVYRAVVDKADFPQNLQWNAVSL
jgi:salicylate hydroxylase